MEIQNITLAVPKKILAKFKQVALHRQKSISGLMVEMMEEVVRQEEGYHAAHTRYQRRMDSGMNLNTQGNAVWKRDELHER